MNENRIADAARRITVRRAALKWLEEYGPKLSGRDDSATVSVRLSLASACPGSKEAEEVISAYARFSLPDMVRSATECCRNDIAMSVDAIRQEIAKVDDEGVI